MTTFGPPASSVEGERERLSLERALRALVAGVGRLGKKRLDVEQIDGEKARTSQLLDAFVRAGFRVGYRGLEVDRLRPASGVGRDASFEDDAPGADADRGDDGES